MRMNPRSSSGPQIMIDFILLFHVIYFTSYYFILFILYYFVLFLLFYIIYGPCHANYGLRLAVFALRRVI